MDSFFNKNKKTVKKAPFRGLQGMMTGTGAGTKGYILFPRESGGENGRGPQGTGSSGSPGSPWHPYACVLDSNDPACLRATVWPEPIWIKVKKS